jgi:hypothetical protein
MRSIASAHILFAAASIALNLAAAARAADADADRPARWFKGTCTRIRSGATGMISRR